MKLATSLQEQPRSIITKNISNMKKIEQLFKNNTPFSVMMYFESLKSNKKETNKVYELMQIKDGIDKNGKKFKYISFVVLKKEEVSFIKENLSKFKEVINSKDGLIWEFNNFKAYKEECLPQKQKLWN